MPPTMLVALVVLLFLQSWRATLIPLIAVPVAIVGTFAVMMGLGFSLNNLSLSTILDEANAIGTTYLRAGMLPEPLQTELRQLLRQYVDARLEGAQPGRLAQALARSTELHQQLWDQATEVAKVDPHSIVNGLFIQSLNQVIDLLSARLVLGVRSRLPATVWEALFIVAFSSMVTVGYQEGLSGTRRSPASLGLVVAFSVVLWLIIDLVLIRPTRQELADFGKPDFVICHTRAIIDAIHTGQLANSPRERHPIFGFEVVTACPDVPSEILRPRETWREPAAYDAAARKLAGLFIENFKQYETGVSADVRKASPAV